LLNRRRASRGEASAGWLPKATGALVIPSGLNPPEYKPVYYYVRTSFLA
jgi:hypothetical protein